MVALILGILATLATGPIGDFEGVEGGMDYSYGASCTGEVTWPGDNVDYAHLTLYRKYGSVWEEIDDDDVWVSGDTYFLLCENIDGNDPNPPIVEYKVVCTLISGGSTPVFPPYEEFEAPDDFILGFKWWYHYKNFNFPK